MDMEHTRISFPLKTIRSTKWRPLQSLQNMDKTRSEDLALGTLEVNCSAPGVDINFVLLEPEQTDAFDTLYSKLLLSGDLSFEQPQFRAQNNRKTMAFFSPDLSVPRDTSAFSPRKFILEII